MKWKMQLSDLKDKYKGKPCAIICSGPSLHFINIKLLKDVHCIAVNSGVMKYREIDFFGFISDDVAVKNWHYFTQILPTLNCVKFLFEKKLRKHSKKLNNVVYYSHKSWFSPPKTYNLPDGLRLTKGEPIVGARVSSGSAVHIAYVLGFNPIILLGNDCCFKRDVRYFWEYPGEEQTYRVNGDNSFFYNKRAGFDSKAFITYWNKFAEVNSDIIGEEVNIIDASCSPLSCFPKMSLEQVLEQLI